MQREQFKEIGVKHLPLDKSYIIWYNNTNNGDRGAQRTLLLLDAIFRNSLGNHFHNRTKG